MNNKNYIYFIQCNKISKVYVFAILWYEKRWTTKIFITILGDTLYGNGIQFLNSSDYLESKNRCYKLTLQNDGNLVMTNQHSEEKIWASNTRGKVS